MPWGLWSEPWHLSPHHRNVKEKNPAQNLKIRSTFGRTCCKQYTTFREFFPARHQICWDLPSVFTGRTFLFVLLTFHGVRFQGPRFPGFWHLTEGLWKCLICHIAILSSISPPPPNPHQSPAAHPSPQLLSPAPPALTCAGGLHFNLQDSHLLFLLLKSAVLH